MLLSAKTVEIVARNVAAGSWRACKAKTSGGPLVDSDVARTPETKPEP